MQIFVVNVAVLIFASLKVYCVCRIKNFLRIKKSNIFLSLVILLLNASVELTATFIYMGSSVCKFRNYCSCIKFLKNFKSNIQNHFYKFWNFFIVNMSSFDGAI